MKESSVVRAYVSLAALSSLSPSPLPGSLVAPRYVAKEGGVSGGGCNGHVGAFLRASLVRCSVLTIQSRTAERARSPLHSALHSVFAAPRSGFVRNCMRRGGHASWASQSEESRVDANLGEIGTSGNCPLLTMEGDTGPCRQHMGISWLRNSPD